MWPTSCRLANYAGNKYQAVPLLPGEGHGWLDVVKDDMCAVSLTTRDVVDDCRLAN